MLVAIVTGSDSGIERGAAVRLAADGAYAAAKHGLGGLTKQFALELGRDGIAVNAVAPGMVATPMTELEDEDPSEHPKPELPTPRPGDAREIAACGRTRPTSASGS